MMIRPTTTLSFCTTFVSTYSPLDLRFDFDDITTVKSKMASAVTKNERLGFGDYGQIFFAVGKGRMSTKAPTSVCASELELR
jgi:hypothetical protein